jgi:phosphopantothenoylcysteine synthetase/decarboxylase
MEEIEISSWLTLDALKKKAEVAETVGNLQTGHSMSVFCQIEDDFLELVYTDATTNCLRRYEDKDEFEAAIEQRKEEDGEAAYDDDRELDDDDDDDDEDDDFEAESDEDDY